MKEITKLDNKYLVVKIKDINDFLGMGERETLAMLLMKVDGKRSQKGKHINEYLVLNLDDDIDLKYLRSRILDAFDRPMGSVWRFRVREIAVDLVNSVLKAKGD